MMIYLETKPKGLINGKEPVKTTTIYEEDDLDKALEYFKLCSERGFYCKLYNLF